MPDIRDIVGQTSALEKLPRIDQRSQETRAGKEALAQIDQQQLKSETVRDVKESDSKTIRKDQEREKEKREAAERKEKKEITREEEEERKDKIPSEIAEVDEGKIIDLKV